MHKAANYLLNNRAFLRYDEYLEAGLPIASGVIEGACRHLVKDRMDITGARWGLETAEAVLKMRAIKTSGDLEGYWRFHQRQHRDRVHGDLYEQSRASADNPHNRPQRSHLTLLQGGVAASS